jgi:hypothetical protein
MRTKLWVHSVLRARDIQHHAPDKYCEVRYENLCTNPEHTIQSICSAINVDYQKAMLGPLAVPHASPSRANATLASGAPKKLEELVGWPPEWSGSDREQYSTSAGSLHAEVENELPRTQA